MKLNALFIAVIFLAAFIVACKKESGTTTLRIRLTDAPASYEEVNIDLKEVNVKLNDDSSGWITMETKAGIYNLLGLQNGIDTLISEGEFPQGTVKEIRLVLGNENTIKEGGEVHPLTIPSGSESGLKIKLNKSLQGGIDSVIVDFDAAMSVNLESGGYKLRPVIRVVE